MGWDGNWEMSWADTILAKTTRLQLVSRTKNQGARGESPEAETSHRSIHAKRGQIRVQTTLWKSREEILILMLIDCFDALLPV